jgi:ribonuclease-3
MESKVMEENHPYSMENLLALKTKLGITMENDDLLKTAITTSAAKNEHPEIIEEDNERLEFLGDSVLKFLLSENLYKSKPNPEGKMTIMRTEIENNETLASIAKEIDLKPHLFLGEAEKKCSGKWERTLLANSLEAIIGAIYLDQDDLEKTRRFMEKKILQELLQILLTKDVRDPVTPLQEISQKRYGKLPKYVYEQISGPPNEHVFNVAVYLNNEKITEAQGTSKKEAKKKVAKKALFLITN